MDSQEHIDPSRIMQVGTGFFATKTLLSAVELGLFTSLAREPKTGAAIASELGLTLMKSPMRLTTSMRSSEVSKMR